MLELYCNFHNIFLCENSFCRRAEFWVKVAKRVDSDYCLMDWPTRIGALNIFTKMFSIYNFVCVFSVYTLQPDFCPDPSEWNLQLMSLDSGWHCGTMLFFSLMIRLFVWNWQLFSCSEIFSSLKSCWTFLLFTFELRVWYGGHASISLYCDAAQKMKPTLITLFGCVFNMTDIIMILYVILELWILNAWTYERKCFSFCRNGWHTDFN
jgi:hypothetical protein